MGDTEASEQHMSIEHEALSDRHVPFQTDMGPLEPPLWHRWLSQSNRHRRRPSQTGAGLLRPARALIGRRRFSRAGTGPSQTSLGPSQTGASCLTPARGPLRPAQDLSDGHKPFPLVQALSDPRRLSQTSSRVSRPSQTGVGSLSKAQEPLRLYPGHFWFSQTGAGPSQSCSSPSSVFHYGVSYHRPARSPLTDRRRPSQTVAGP